MARLAWVDFMRAHRGAHLVAAVVVPARSPQRLKRLHRLLRQVIAELAPQADFSTAIVRLAETEIHCAFADKADADRFADVAEAAPVAPVLEGWSTHRSFRIDAAKEVALAGTLAVPGQPPGAPDGPAADR